MAIASDSLLLCLPQELRDQIYRLLIVRPTRLRRPHRYEPPQNHLNTNVFLLSKAIYHESLQLFCRENAFLTSHMFTTSPVHAGLWPTRIAPLSNAQLSLIRDITIRVHAAWDPHSFLPLYELWKGRTDIRRLVVEVHLPNLSGVHLVCTQQAAPIREQLSALFKLRNIRTVKLEVHWIGWWNAYDLDEVLRDLESMAKAMGKSGSPSSSPRPLDTPMERKSSDVEVRSKLEVITAPAYQMPTLAFPLERMSPTRVSASSDNGSPQVAAETEAIVNRYLDGLGWRWVERTDDAAEDGVAPAVVEL